MILAYSRSSRAIENIYAFQQRYLHKSFQNWESEDGSSIYGIFSVREVKFR